MLDIDSRPNPLNGRASGSRSGASIAVGCVALCAAADTKLRGRAGWLAGQQLVGTAKPG